MNGFRKKSVEGVTPFESSEGMPLCTPAALDSVPVPSLCNFIPKGLSFVWFSCDHAYSCFFLTPLLPACHNVNRFVASCLFFTVIVYP